MALLNSEKLLDSALHFMDAGAMSADNWGQVDGADGIIDLGSSALVYFDIVAKVTAATGNATLRLMGSNTDPAGDADAHNDWHLLHTLEIGTVGQADVARQCGIYSICVDNRAVLNATSIAARDYEGMRWLAVHVDLAANASITTSVDGALRQTV